VTSSWPTSGGHPEPGRLLSGLCQPIVLILLLIAFFTTISGKPPHGFLMLTVAILLVWDAARSRLALYADWPSGAGALVRRSSR
jgi:hypothetical protein